METRRAGIDELFLAVVSLTTLLAVFALWRYHYFADVVAAAIAVCFFRWDVSVCVYVCIYIYVGIINSLSRSSLCLCAFH